MLQRLPVPGKDNGAWGNILNNFLQVEHNIDGTLKATGSLAAKADVDSLAPVALSGAYADLANKPSIPDPALLVANADLDTKTSALVATVGSSTAGALKANFVGAAKIAEYSRRPLIGAFCAPVGSGGPTLYSSLRALETQLGVDFDVTSNYIGVSGSSAEAGLAATAYTTEVTTLLAADKNRQMMLVIEPFAGATGETKGLVELVNALTGSVKTAGQTAFYNNLVGLFDAIVAGGNQDRLSIAPMHECNGPGADSPWQIYGTNAVNPTIGVATPNTSALFVQAYRALVSLARSRGITAKFIQWFLTNNSGSSQTDYSMHYAGDEYVDIVGLTYYNRYNAGGGYAYWEPVGHNLREPMRMIERMTANPVWICESSCAPEGASGRSKSQWLSEIIQTVASAEWPRIEALVLFLVNAAPGTANWSLENTDQQAAVARAISNVRRGNRQPDPGVIGRNFVPRAAVFPSTTSGWTVNGAGATITASVDTDIPAEIPSGLTSLKLTKSAGNAGSDAAEVQAYRIPLDDSWYVPGQAYVLSFWARSDVSGLLLRAGLRQNAAPNTQVGDRDIHITNGWNKYIVQIASSTAKATSWRLPWFGLGRTTGAATLWLTAIKVERGVQATPLFEHLLSPRVNGLVDGATITPVADYSDICTVTLAGNRTLAAPSGTPYDGQELEIRFAQDSVGSRTVTLAAGYAVSINLPFSLSTAALAVDRAKFRYDAISAKWQLVSLIKGF